MLTIKTKVGPSGVQGIGLFADQFISKGSIIHRWVEGLDKSFTAEELTRLPEVTQRHIHHYGYIGRKSGQWMINFDDIRFTNHSETPNIAPDFSSADAEPPVIALCDIEPGEELLEDYRAFSTNADEHEL